MDKFKEINRACVILGLAETATMAEIKHHYRSLMAKWHPDRCEEDPETCRKKTEEIMNAYRTIKAYCDNYKFSFAKEEVEKHLSPEEWWFRQFGPDAAE